jgi:acetyl esterase/lipase
MRSFLIVAALLLEFASLSYSQHRVIDIWQTGQQSAKSQLNIEKRKGNNITEVNRPCLDVLLPIKPNANHPAVLVFPGGGYRQIVIEKEGYKIAKWLNDNGIAAFVLTYRLNRDSALSDAQRAVSLVRSRAKEFNIDPDRIGVMGFSAGAHLSLNAATHLNRSIRDDLIDSVSCKPNFMVLAYGTFTGLMKLVDKETPPAFLVHASNDKRAPVSQSVNLFSALHDVDVPVEMHIYEQGGHGFALLEDRGPVVGWAQQCIDWMRMRGIVSVR